MAPEKSSDSEHDDRVRQAMESRRKQRRFALADAMVKILSGLIGILFLFFAIYNAFFRK